MEGDRRTFLKTTALIGGAALTGVVAATRSTPAQAQATSGGQKLGTLTQVAPGATAHSWWNNANAEVYSLQAWPIVAPGVSASAEITKISYVVHGSPSERELHYWVKNTGSTPIDIAIWAFWWNA
jgi:hypothetical protein